MLVPFQLCVNNCGAKVFLDFGAREYMAWDDPVVWILIVGLGILLFGSNKIPEIARSLGAARREFDAASKGLMDTINSEINPAQQSPARVQRPLNQQANISRPSPRVQRPVNQPAAPVSESGTAATAPAPASDQLVTDNDPLLTAARSEGIDTRGKTRSQIASELAGKVKD
jgi:TatA/E family protein of Tat protein translocase